MLENMAEKENHGSSVPELNSVGATGIKIQDIYQQIITKAYNEDKDMVQMNPTPSELPKEDDNVEKGPALLVDNLTQALKSHPAYKQNMKIRHYKLNIPPDADKEKFVKVVSDTLVKTAPQQIKLGAGRKGLLYTLPNTAVKQFQMKSEIPNADTVDKMQPTSSSLPEFIIGDKSKFEVSKATFELVTRQGVKPDVKSPEQPEGSHCRNDESSDNTQNKMFEQPNTSAEGQLLVLGHPPKAILQTENWEGSKESPTPNSNKINPYRIGSTHGKRLKPQTNYSMLKFPTLGQKPEVAPSVKIGPNQQSFAMVQTVNIVPDVQQQRKSTVSSLNLKTVSTNSDAVQLVPMQQLLTSTPLSAHLIPVQIPSPLSSGQILAINAKADKKVGLTFKPPTQCLSVVSGDDASEAYALAPQTKIAKGVYNAEGVLTAVHFETVLPPGNDSSTSKMSEIIKSGTPTEGGLAEEKGNSWPSQSARKYGRPRKQTKLNYSYQPWETGSKNKPIILDVDGKGKERESFNLEQAFSYTGKYPGYETLNVINKYCDIQQARGQNEINDDYVDIATKYREKKRQAVPSTNNNVGGSDSDTVPPIDQPEIDVELLRELGNKEWLQPTTLTLDEKEQSADVLDSLSCIIENTGAIPEEYSHVFFDDVKSMRVGADITVGDVLKTPLYSNHGIDLCAPLGVTLDELMTVTEGVETDFGTVMSAWTQEVYLVSAELTPLVDPDPERELKVGKCLTFLEEDKLAVSCANNFMFQCFSCLYTSLSQSAVTKHWLLHHLNIMAYKCHYCEKSFTSGFAAQTHMREMHNGSEMLVDLNTNKRLDVPVYVVKKHDHGIIDGLEAANIWDRQFDRVRGPSYTTLRTKRKNKNSDGKDDYTDKTVFKCRKCPFATSSLLIMKKHNHRNVSSCTMCLACAYIEYRGKEFMKNHIEKSHLDLKPFVCSFCFKFEMSSRAVVSHIVQEHDGVVPADCAHLHFSQKKLILSPTAWTFYFKALPLKFYNVPDEYVADSSKYIVLKVGRRKLLICKHCSFVTENENDMGIHVHSQHKDYVRKLLVCGKCMYVYVAKLKVKASVKGKSCPSCMKTLYIQDLMPYLKCMAAGLPGAGARHVAVSGEEQYIYNCRLCSALISGEEANLMTHMQKHCPLQPFCCPYCNFKWVTHEAVATHVAGEHPSEAMVVNIQRRNLKRFNNFIQMNSVKVCLNSETSRAWIKKKQDSKEPSLISDEETDDVDIVVTHSGKKKQVGNVHRPQIVGEDVEQDGDINVELKTTNRNRSDYGQQEGHFSFYKCLECSYVSQDVTAVKRHVKYMHTNARAYKCLYCDYQSVECTKIKVHQKMKHRGEAMKVLCDRAVQKKQNNLIKSMYTLVRVPTTPDPEAADQDHTYKDKKRKRTHSPHKPNKKRTSVRQSMGIRTPVPVQLFSKDLPVPPVMNFPATIKEEHTEPTEHMEFSWYDEVMNEMIPIKTEADATHLPTFCTSGHEDPKLKMKTSVALENLNLKEEDGPWHVPDMISSIEFPPEFSLTADKPFVEMDYAYDPCVDSNRDVSVYGTINMPYLNWSTNIDELPVYDWEDGKKREGNRTETYSRNIMKKKKNHVESSGGTTTVIKLEVEKREECQPPVQVSSRLIEDENSEEELDVENHTDASHSPPYTGHNINCVEVKQEPL